MIRIYERSLCQSYASAYRQGILLAKTDDEAEALSIVESLTDDTGFSGRLDEDTLSRQARRRVPGRPALQGGRQQHGRSRYEVDRREDRHGRGG